MGRLMLGHHYCSVCGREYDKVIFGVNERADRHGSTTICSACKKAKRDKKHAREIARARKIASKSTRGVNDEFACYIETARLKVANEERDEARRARIAARDEEFDRTVKITRTRVRHGDGLLWEHRH